jgi:hypothetical protein
MTTSQAASVTPVDRELALDEELAPDSPAGTPGQRRKPRETALLAGVFALGCLACLLPGLLAGGALAATFGALGADEIIFGALAVALAIAAIAVVLVRRSRKAGSGSDGCGC